LKAATLAVVLRQRSHGEVADPRDPMPDAPGGTDLDQAMDDLVRVALAYASSSVVRAARERRLAGSERAERAIA
jgi:hypothetical protein